MQAETSGHTAAAIVCVCAKRGMPGSMIFLGQASLRRAVIEYIEHYHAERNHQGLENRLIRLSVAKIANHGAIHRRARLSGTLNFYYRKAA